jgi:hypothetical protein
MPEGFPEGAFPVGMPEGAPDREGMPEGAPLGRPEAPPGIPEGRVQFCPPEVLLFEDDESPEPQAASRGESARRATKGTSRARRFMG